MWTLALALPTTSQTACTPFKNLVYGFRIIIFKADIVCPRFMFFKASIDRLDVLRLKNCFKGQSTCKLQIFVSKVYGLCRKNNTWRWPPAPPPLLRRIQGMFDGTHYAKGRYAICTNPLISKAEINFIFKWCNFHQVTRQSWPKMSNFTLYFFACSLRSRLFFTFHHF